MSKVSRPAAGANPGHVEGTHFAPPRGVRRIDFERDGGLAQVPWQLLDLGASAIQIRVFLAIDGRAREEGATCCIPGTRWFETVGLLEGSARKAIRWLADRGVIVTEHVMIGGVRREVIHCPWLFPAAWAGVVVDFGHGVSLDVDTGRRVATSQPKPPPAPSPRATIPFAPACVPGIAKCAPQGAPPSAPIAEGFPEKEKSNARPGCVAALASAGEESLPLFRESTAEPEPILPADPAKVADLVANLRATPPTDRVLARLHPATVKRAYHELLQLGPNLVPADLAADLAERFGPPPPPQPVRVKVEAPPAPATTKALIFRLANPTGPDAVTEVCQRLARDLRSQASRFEANVRAAAAGEVRPDVLWQAFEQATGPGAKQPGAVFNAAVNRMRARAPR